MEVFGIKAREDWVKTLPNWPVSCSSRGAQEVHVCETKGLALSNQQTACAPMLHHGLHHAFITTVNIYFKTVQNSTISTYDAVHSKSKIQHFVKGEFWLYVV